MTLAEAATGVTKEVKVLRRAPCAHLRRQRRGAPARTPETCQHCGGRGQVMHSQGFLMISTTCPVCRGEGRVVRKPCASCDGTGLEQQEETLQVEHPGRRRGRLDAAPGRPRRGGAAGGRPGNLYVVLRVEADERFERDGADLHTEVAVSFPAARARRHDRRCRRSTARPRSRSRRARSPARRSCCAGGACRASTGGARGDIVAHVKLVVPTSLSAEEEAHLRAYAAAGGQRVSPERGGFFKRKKKK